LRKQQLISALAVIYFPAKAISLFRTSRVRGEQAERASETKQNSSRSLLKFSRPRHYIQKQEQELVDGWAMGRYPDLQPTLPANVLTPSRMQRILQPSIVLVTVVLLGAMSLMRMIVAAVISWGGMHSKSVNATLAFALIAVSPADQKSRAR
jgi:hypothetical protein